MSVTTSNFHFGSTGWCSRTSMMLMTGASDGSSASPNVDDGLTSLSWLQNLNMCRLGAPTPPTPPASPVCSSNCSINALTANTNKLLAKNIISSKADAIHNSNVHKIQSIFQSHKEGRNQSHGSSNSSKKSSQTNENESIDYKTNGSVKPPFSYATLICMAMKANKNKMTLSAIYKWIRENFLYYRNADPSWQVWPECEPRIQYRIHYDSHSICDVRNSTVMPHSSHSKERENVLKRASLCFASFLFRRVM